MVGRPAGVLLITPMVRTTAGAEMRKRIPRVTNRRARLLLELIVEHDEVTTEELADQYDYDHPPRAKRDALDLGFPVVSRRVRSKDGTRSIAAYSLDLNGALVDRRTGRKRIPKAFRDELLKLAGGRCAHCGGAFPDRALQVDHRIPHEIAGEVDQFRLADFQMLCGPCNRSKSWTCERECPNWTKRSVAVCATCIWASPEGYKHIATHQRRQVTLTWDGADVEMFDGIRVAAQAEGVDVATHLQRLLGER
jgi:5-methylcytosine-specific restriction endonuclease McrA